MYTAEIEVQSENTGRCYDFEICIELSGACHYSGEYSRSNDMFDVEGLWFERGGKPLTEKRQKIIEKYYGQKAIDNRIELAIERVCDE